MMEQAYADTRRVSNKYMWSAAHDGNSNLIDEMDIEYRNFSIDAKTSEGFVMSGFLLNPKA